MPNGAGISAAEGDLVGVVFGAVRLVFPDRWRFDLLFDPRSTLEVIDLIPLFDRLVEGFSFFTVIPFGWDEALPSGLEEDLDGVRNGHRM